MNTSGGKSYPRRYRIESLVHRGLSPILAETHSSVTIRRIVMNGDYSVANVYYSVLSGDIETAGESLTQDAYRIRRRLAGTLNMRSTPKLVFFPDEEGEAADDMRKLLDSLATDGGT